MNVQGRQISNRAVPDILVLDASVPTWLGRCPGMAPLQDLDARLFVRADDKVVWPEGLSLRHSLRSEEHTSELQSRGHIVYRLLLETTKNNNNETENNC